MNKLLRDTFTNGNKTYILINIVQNGENFSVC
jgi:hypothetical protein